MIARHHIRTRPSTFQRIWNSSVAILDLPEEYEFTIGDHLILDWFDEDRPEQKGGRIKARISAIKRPEGPRIPGATVRLGVRVTDRKGHDEWTGNANTR